MKARFLTGLALAASLSLASFPALAKNILVGVTPGPHEEVMEKVAEVIAQQSEHTIEIIAFSDYVIPNQALNDGDLDANSFQHKPYLDAQAAARGYDLVVIGMNFLTPMGLYSEKYEDLDALPESATIAIPNDPTNGARGLLVLQQAGLIELDDSLGIDISIIDITENPKNFRFIELDAAQLPRALGDVDLASINTNYAIGAGLNPVADSLAIEDPTGSPYANLVAVRRGDEDTDWAKALINAYHSDEVRQFIIDTYEGSVLPSF